MPPKIEVVAGIVFNGAGEILLSSRPEGKAYAGYWEFAGGKVETGESGLAALQREFMEELGIRIRQARPWLARVHLYEHAEVHLRFWRVAADEWSGAAQAREGQRFVWRRPDAAQDLPMLPANAPLFKALAVPEAFSGSLNGVLRADSGYCVVPFDVAGAHHDAVWIDCDRLRARGRLPQADSVWVRIGSAAQLMQAADADVLLFAAADEARAAEVLRLLDEGVAVPLVVAADAGLCRRFGAQWRAAGAQAVVCDEETFAV